MGGQEAEHSSTSTPQEPANEGGKSLVEPTPCTGANDSGTLESHDADWKAFILSIDGEAEDKDIDGAVSFLMQARRYTNTQCCCIPRTRRPPHQRRGARGATKQEQMKLISGSAATALTVTRMLRRKHHLDRPAALVQVGLSTFTLRAISTSLL